MQLCKTSFLTLSAGLAATAASAQVSEKCRTPTFSDVGWTHITATTARPRLRRDSALASARRWARTYPRAA